MEFMSGTENGVSLPPGVTPITDLKNQKRANKTLSKAVSLHLEGKLESAARLLSKALDDGERDAGLYSALGHIQCEMQDYQAAAGTYARLTDLDPRHRTAWFNLGVCQGHTRQWRESADAFRRAIEVDATRSDAVLGRGIALIHEGRPNVLAVGDDDQAIYAFQGADGQDLDREGR